MEVPDHPSLDLSNDFTLEAWIKLPPSQGTALYTSLIVGKADNNFNTTGNYWLIVNNPDNRLLLMIGDGVGGSQFVTGTSNLGTDTWMHVAGVRSNTALRVYVNGILENTVARTLNQQTNNAPLRMGGVPSVHGSLLFLQGLVDDVRVWNIARTAQEVQGTMLQSLGGSEPGLVGYWRMDEGAGQQVRDASPVGNSGVLGTNAGLESSDPTWTPFGAPLIAPGGTPGSPVLTGTVAGTQVTLNWIPGPGGPPVSYTLQAATDQAFAQIFFNQNLGLATSATGSVPSGFSGWARVLANGNSGEATSNTFFISTGGCGAPPSAPTGLLVIKSGVNVTASWNVSAGASSYRVEADVNGAPNVFNANVGNVTSVTGQNLAPAAYVVRVFATSPCGASPPVSAAFTIP